MNTYTFEALGNIRVPVMEIKFRNLYNNNNEINMKTEWQQLHEE